MKPAMPGRFLFTVVLLLALAPPVHALQDACAQPRNAVPGALDELTWQQLDSVYRAIGDARYDEARADLDTMLLHAGSDPYLRAIVNRALGQVEMARGRFGPALDFLEVALELDALPDPAHYALMYQLARLYLVQGRPAEAQEKLERWFCSVPPDQPTAEAWAFKASILARQDEFSGVLEAIDVAIGMEQSPPEPWYQLKLAAHIEQEQYAKAAETLQILLAGWPEAKRYWVQLAQLYYRLGQDQRALAVQALAWRQGLLDGPSDILFLAGLYNELQSPYQAAAVLEQAMADGLLAADREHWTQAAGAWHAAGELERALAAWEAAGRDSGDGLPDLHRGYLLADLERWPEALQAMDRALDRGGLSDRQAGQALLLRGLAQFRLGDLEGAGADWALAGRFESARAAARRWLDFLQEERQRG